MDFSGNKLMHSWGFALKEGVFAKPKEIYIKIQKERKWISPFLDIGMFLPTPIIASAPLHNHPKTAQDKSFSHRRRKNSHVKKKKIEKRGCMCVYVCYFFSFVFYLTMCEY